MELERFFDGYNVPPKLKGTVIAICTRFAVSGECDPMYLSNVIASINGFGDGCGSFSADGQIDAAKSAERIQGCYSCNILPGELGELIEIMNTGRISDKAKAVAGLNSFKARTQAQIEKQDSREDYLNYLLKTIDSCIRAITDYA